MGHMTIRDNEQIYCDICGSDNIDILETDEDYECLECGHIGAI